MAYDDSPCPDDLDAMADHLRKEKKKVEDKLPILVQWSMVVIYVIYQQQCQVGFIPHHSSSKFRFMIMGIEDKLNNQQSRAAIMESWATR